MSLEPIREFDDVPGEILRGATADAARAERGESARHLPQDVSLERVGIRGRDDGVQDDPLDCIRVSKRVSERQLGSVRHAEEPDASGSQRNPDRLQVFGVVARRIEASPRSDDGRAVAGEGCAACAARSADSVTSFSTS